MPIAKNPEPGTPLWQLVTNIKCFRHAGDANAADAVRSAERSDENYRKAEEFERAARILSDGLNVEPLVSKNPEPGTPLWQLLSNAKSLRLAGDTNAADAVRSAERRDENYREAEEYERAARILSDGLNVDPQTAAEIKRKITYV